MTDLIKETKKAVAPGCSLENTEKHTFSQETSVAVT